MSPFQNFRIFSPLQELNNLPPHSFYLHLPTSTNFKNVVAANSRLFWDTACDVCGTYLYSITVLFIACYAGLGQGLPEVKPSTSGPLPVRLKELTGKLRWMNWEPPLRMPLSKGRRSRGEGFPFWEFAPHADNRPSNRPYLPLVAITRTSERVGHSSTAPGTGGASQGVPPA